MNPEVKLLNDLVGMYSPSGKEGVVASALRRWLSDHSSFDNIGIDSAGNVIAELGQGPYFLFCSHMDTVPGRLHVSSGGGMITGRGAVDAKASLAAMCVAASESSNLGIKGIMFAGVVGEETEGRGMKYLLSKPRRYVGGVFGEPSGGGIVVGYRGRLGLRLSIAGKAAHASSAALGVNAIESGLAQASQLKDSLLGIGCSASITVVRGGRAENMIPSRCFIAMDVRIPSSVRTEEVVRTVQALRSAGTTVVTSELTPSINVGRSNKVYSAASAAVREAGLQPRAVIKLGTSDMNAFFQTTGAPCVAFGPGDAALSHTDFERVSEEEYLQGIRIYESMMKKVLRG